jgi:exoribonuclease-2
VGIHIAAPALGLAPGGVLDLAAAARQSTVYLPGDKITMLPAAVIDRYTLREGGARPVVSLYVYLDDALVPTGFETRVERVHVAANLRHDEIESRFSEQAIAAGDLDFPFGPELARLHAFALKLEAARGRPELAPDKRDYAFYVEDGRVRIVERRRGSPMDRLVAELMILVNSHWGGELAEARVPAIYRVQNGGRTRMSLAPAPHEGLGVEQYAWSSSPLRRYVDLVNQRQIIARAQGEDPPYRKGADDLAVVLRDFEAAYEAYSEFQRHMERYWCLRWIEQESAWRCRATVLRENLVRFERIPLYTRVPSLPPEVAPGSAVEVDVSAIDFLTLDFDCRFVARA